MGVAAVRGSVLESKHHTVGVFNEQAAEAGRLRQAGPNRRTVLVKRHGNKRARLKRLNEKVRQKVWFTELRNSLDTNTDRIKFQF